MDTDSLVNNLKSIFDIPYVADQIKTILNR